MNKEQAAPVVVVSGGGIGSMFLAAIIDNFVFILMVFMFILILYLVYKYRKTLLALWQTEQVLKTKEQPKKEEKKDEPSKDQRKGDETPSEKQTSVHPEKSK